MTGSTGMRVVEGSRNVENPCRLKSESLPDRAAAAPELLSAAALYSSLSLKGFALDHGDRR